jgi:hypothetical protein
MSSEPFVLMANPSIDPQMVVAAPAGIDEAMVHHPSFEGRVAPRVLAVPQPGDPSAP